MGFGAEGAGAGGVCAGLGAGLPLFLLGHLKTEGQSLVDAVRRLSEGKPPDHML